MSHAPALDESRAHWLAGIDPALALLPRALPPASFDSSWLLHDVRWDPGIGCRLAYRVESPGSVPAFVAVHVTPTGWRHDDYRDDAHIAGLRLATDPDWIAARMTSVIAEPLLACAVEPVRYRPGSHCVLRYVVRTATGSRSLYGKVFGADAFTGVVTRATALAGTEEGARLVAAVAASWPEVYAAVGAGITGPSVAAVLADPTASATRQLRIAHQLGALLARFHGIRDIEAPAWSATDHIASLAQSLGAVRAADAQLGNRIAAVLDVLGASLPASTRRDLGHGGFRAGQVFESEHGLVVLDIDGLCRCDPGRDLGTVLAHLRWQAIRHPERQQVLHGAERSLLTGYEARAGRVDPDDLAWWRAAGLLQVGIRRYRRLEVADWPSVPLLVDAAAELLTARHAHTAPGGATDPLDPRQVTTVLRLGLSAASTPGALEVESAEPVASAPGRRAVVRYRIRGLTGEASVIVIGKTFTESRRAQLLHEHLRMLHAGPFGHGALRVPEPVALLCEQRLVLYRYFHGTPLDRVTDTASLEDGVRRAARWLARLHTSPVAFSRRWSQESEEHTTRQWAAVIGRLHPPLAEPARRLADAWAQAARGTGCADEVPIHKDFHAGHVLIGEDTCVVDLDEARQGDAAFDLAHFCGYLDLIAGDAERTRLGSIFVEEYVAATGWRDRGSFAPCLAYTCLKIARQCAGGAGPCRDVPPAQRFRGAEAALERGWQCLSG